MATEVRVEITDEYLSTLVKDPLGGVIELIDNALDADANNIDIRIDRDGLDHITSVTVSDDGTGMTPEDAANRFRPLGKSPKRAEKVGPRGRARRGSRGRGRFAAYALGNTVVWKSTTRTPTLGSSAGSEALETQPSGTGVRIRGTSDDVERFFVSDPFRSDEPNGTTVTITDTSAPTTARRADRLDKVPLRAKLAQTYAPYLARQQSLRMTINGQPLDPSRLHAQVHELPLEVGAAVADAPVAVRVIEWTPQVTAKRPTLVLRDGDGDALLDLAVLPPAPFHYSAYLDWVHFPRHESQLPLAETDQGPVGDVVSAAIAAITGWLHDRTRSARAQVIDDWIAEESYPYAATRPRTPLQRIERDMFDVVATTAAPVLAAGDARSRKLSLRLIQEALRRDPEEVTEVLEQVLKLPKAELRDLRALLARTTLSNVVAASQIVAHRTRVLDSLAHIMNVGGTRAGVTERPIHELVSGEPWLFGDSYTMALSERGLTEVLRTHRALLGDPALLDDPDLTVTVDGAIARIDLLLSRTVEHDSNSRDNLVVELKRSGLAIGFDETAQLQKYAYTIAGDPRFRDQRVRWDFLMVGSTIDPLAAKQADPDTGIIAEQDGVRVRMTSWDTLVRVNRHRMRFVADALDLAADDGTGAEQLTAVRNERVSAEAQQADS